MKYLKENGELFKKYLLVIIFNIIIYILTSFYLKASDTQSIIMLFIVLISDFIIYYYKGTKVFKFYLDQLANILTGLLLLIIIKDEYIYITTLLSLYLPNNIVFMRSRISNSFFKRSLQYLLSFFSAILCILVNIFFMYAFYGK